VEDEEEDEEEATSATELEKRRGEKGKGEFLACLYTVGARAEKWDLRARRTCHSPCPTNTSC